MPTKWVWIACFFAALAWPACGHAQAKSQDQASATYVFNLPAQPLANSLRALGTVAGVNVVFDPTAVAEHRAHELRGRYPVRAALDRLLAGTNLVVEFTAPDTVVVKRRAAGGAAVATPGTRAAEASAPGDSRTMDTIQVVGQAQALSATRSDTPLREIPQSVSIISRETLDQQNATDLTSALEYAPGFTLEQHSSQQSYIYSRGYLVDSVHIDGGAPMRIAQGTINAPDAGSMNLAEYDSIEVLRGSDGLFGGMGNPGATLSLNRKEPTRTYRAQISASLGSWNQRRFVGDVSGPLTSRLSGRVVVSQDRSDYFYDIANMRGYMAYGVLKYDFGPATSLSFGGSFQRNLSIKNSYGLPRYADGSDPHLPHSLALTTPWARVDNRFTEGFAKFQHDFNDNWKLRVNGSFSKQSLPEDFNAVYRGPINQTTGLLNGPITSAVDTLEIVQKMMNATLTGSFNWLGHKQDVMLGGDYSHNSYEAVMLSPPASGPPVDPFNYDPWLYPAPDASPEASTYTTTWHNKTNQWGIYGAFRFQPFTGFKITLGGRESGYRQITRSAVSTYGESKFTPYAGITYDIGKHYTAYASWADIYHTNTGLVDKDQNQLQPSNGVNLEAGLKGAWFHNLLNASIAVFKVEQTGLAVLDRSVPRRLNCCYMTANSSSKGFETEVSGALTPNWHITAGYTRNVSSYNSPTLISQQPANLFKLWTNYRLPGRKWSLGGGLRTTSPSRKALCTDYSGGACHEYIHYGQGFYVLADVRVGYRFNSIWSAALNINNIFDRSYWQTVGSTSLANWYGAPRNFMFKLEGKF